MLNLLLETSTEQILVAIADGQRVLAKSSLASGYDHSKELLPTVRSLMDELGVRMEQLSLVTAGIGPGSYTGIRVAVIVAKSLSMALQIPLVGVTSLSCFVAKQDGRFAVLIDAKMGGIYTLFGESLNGLITYQTIPTLMSVPDTYQALKTIPTIVTPRAAPLRRRLDSLGDCPWSWLEQGPDPHQMAKLAAESFERGQYSRDCQLDILYLRPTQAEIERGLQLS